MSQLVKTGCLMLDKIKTRTTQYVIALFIDNKWAVLLKYSLFYSLTIVCCMYFYISAAFFVISFYTFFLFLSYDMFVHENM